MPQPHRPSAPARRVLIIVENLPVPLDRRVWTEALALNKAGYQVSVICPRTEKCPLAFETIDGIDVHRHSIPLDAHGIGGYVLEYAAALFGELRLAWRIRGGRGFDVIQLCNPPDILFLTALPFRWLDGCRIIFDHHDPFPELFAVKFPSKLWLSRLVGIAERLTFRFADRVISTSEALRGLAVSRGGVAPDKVALVRSGIDLTRMPRLPADPALRQGARHLVVYLGLIGSQDGVDILVDAAHHILSHRGRDDIRFLVIGDGPMLDTVKIQAKLLEIADKIEFAGFVSGDALCRLLASADVGVCPDPKNEFNDKLSMNKVLEYMAFGLGMALFPLEESMTLAGPAGEVAHGPEASDLADAILRLIDDEPRRDALKTIARQRVEEHFSWPLHEKIYLEVYDQLFSEIEAAKRT